MSDQRTVCVNCHTGSYAAAALQLLHLHPGKNKQLHHSSHQPLLLQITLKIATNDVRHYATQTTMRRPQCMQWIRLELQTNLTAQNILCTCISTIIWYILWPAIVTDHWRLTYLYQEQKVMQTDQHNQMSQLKQLAARVRITKNLSNVSLWLCWYGQGSESSLFWLKFWETSLAHATVLCKVIQPSLNDQDVVTRFYFLCPKMARQGVIKWWEDNDLPLMCLKVIEIAWHYRLALQHCQTWFHIFPPYHQLSCAKQNTRNITKWHK